MVIKIDTSRITDWNTFHDVFAEAFGFLDFYGRNMDAWIDCMSYLDDPEAGMTTVHVPRGSVVTIHMEDGDEFAQRCPELYEAIIECAAFVNWRRVKEGEPALLALSYYKVYRQASAAKITEAKDA